jgi:hypothetical protein
MEKKKTKEDFHINTEINWGGLIPTERRSCYICGRTEEEVNDLLKEAMWKQEKDTKEKLGFIDIRTARIFSELDFPTIKIEMADRGKKVNKAMLCTMDTQTAITFRFPLCPICDMIYCQRKR